MPSPKKYPDELKERSVRLVFESGRPIAHVARDLGVKYESLRLWVRQAEADSGKRAELLTTSEREHLKELEREVRELRKANEILKAASVFSPRSSTHPGRGEHVRRRASPALRGRVHLRDDRGVGLRLL
ncbi:MAG: transposase [Solirubrobacterales bacterium]